MHAPAAALLLLTSCFSAIPQVAAHRGHAHHVHKRAAAVVTEYVTHVDYATVAVDQDGNTVPMPTATAVMAQDDTTPSADTENVDEPEPSANVAPEPSPASIAQDRATSAAAAEDVEAPALVSNVPASPTNPPANAPISSPAALPQQNVAPAHEAADAKVPVEAADVEVPVAAPSAADIKPVIQQSSTSSPSTSNGQFPFSQIVAFGDSMTDNGNGTFAHCTQAGAGDCGNKIYGYGTWTNGPVAVSYLSDKLGVPLVEDYAWGWNHGGGVGDKMAATIMQAFNPSPDSQSGFQQVASYLSSDKANIAQTLQFLWIGNMDIMFPKFQYPDNSQWSSDMADMISQLVGQLLDAGAPYVFVPGLYAKQISPSHDFMASLPLQQEQMGQAIQQANAAIKSTIEQKYGDKVIYYDVFDRMMDIWNNAGSYGIDMVGDNFCDGDVLHPSNFEVCLMQGQGDRWYWINFTDFTTHVHSLIADDMYSVIQQRFS